MANKTQQVLVAVDNCIFTVAQGRLDVLLIQMKQDPFHGVWALPGGLIDDGERLDGAASRVLEEQTGLRDVYLEQLYSFDDESRDPSGRVVSIAYFSLVQRDRLELKTTDKYKQVRFWGVEGLPGKLAYDHETILDYARARLTAKIQYTNVMWSLLPEKFTLSELQAAYETVLSRRLDKRNFRKKVSSLGIVQASGERSTGGRHRPAMLYSFTSREPEAQIVEIF
ncbi:MAG: NUDIX hydrolase [Acidobacteria bacterium]|nr:MAG: NUDIX hydrolase [Acidobacteriota bacterium]